ncbi:DinB family protein [Pseudarthrobacter sp. J1738]|uniref:DinB family protein n=1 Tax=unclassified Pseudarthrobacter TaxID=2647000 RepID=UPI003D278926
MDTKVALHSYFQKRRAELLGKLDGLDEYHMRRPMTGTGTNLLGLVKHVASVELGYFGETFNRPSGRELPWYNEDAAPDADMWVPAEQSSQEIIELHHFAAEYADQTINALELDAPGEVPWWGPEKRNVTLGQILVHMLSEVAQHLGHADIIRENMDGVVGQGPGDPNVSFYNQEQFSELAARIESAAREAQQSPKI